jgi:hypothetical protein
MPRMRSKVITQAAPAAASRRADVRKATLFMEPFEYCQRL